MSDRLRVKRKYLPLSTWTVRATNANYACLLVSACKSVLGTIGSDKEVLSTEALVSIPIPYQLRDRCQVIRP